MAAIEAVPEAGYPVNGEHHKRLPAGFEPLDKARDRLLRFNALWCGEDQNHPPSLHTPAILDHVTGAWRRLVPAHRRLVDHLG